jgi:hypothetical protein
VWETAAAHRSGLLPGHCSFIQNAEESEGQAFTRHQYAIAVAGLRQEGALIDALSTSRIAERCLDWRERQEIKPTERPSLACGKRHLPDILGRA